MKTPLHIINRVYPNGVMWHVMRHSHTGELRSQFRPYGAEPYSLGRAWTLVRSLPHNPAINKIKLARLLYDGL